MEAPDFRALCAELLEAFEDFASSPHISSELRESYDVGHYLKKARAALEVVPVDNEDLPHWSEGVCGDGAAILRDGVMQPIESVISALNSLQRVAAMNAHNFLASSAAPAPVPVVERLPEAGDCDSEGRCWWFRPVSPILNPYWDLSKGDAIDPVPPTHWLPHWALPLPEAQP